MSVPAKFSGFAQSKDKAHYEQSTRVEYEHKKVKPYDVVIKNIACGVCGSDIHTARHDWGPHGREDLVVGHEIIGHVIAVGEEVTEFKIGQRVGVGAACSSCGSCVRCKSGNEHYCSKRVVTYNGDDIFSDNYVTQGGYASHSIANQLFVFPIPDELETNHAAPLMCAGLTVYSPLVRALGDDGKGKTVGIIGIGGLGHLAIQFAAALGAEVVAFSRSSSKKDEAVKLGASSFIATQEDKDWSKSNSDRFDLILNCGSGIDGMNLSDYLAVLKIDCPFVSVGLTAGDESIAVSPFSFVSHGTSFGATSIGSKKQAIAMLKLAGEKGVKPWVEEIPISTEGIADAFTRVHTGKVRYRCVLTDFDKAFD